MLRRRNSILQGYQYYLKLYMKNMLNTSFKKFHFYYFRNHLPLNIRALYKLYILFIKHFISKYILLLKNGAVSLIFNTFSVPIFYKQFSFLPQNTFHFKNHKLLKIFIIGLPSRFLHKGFRQTDR